MEDGGVPEAAADLRSFAGKAATSEKDGDAGGVLKEIENSCLNCSKPFGKGDVRVMPPRYVLDRDMYVSSGILQRRYLCTSCYSAMRPRSREKLRRGIVSRNGNRVVRSILANFLVR